MPLRPAMRVFLSHIHEEEDLAELVKRRIDAAFQGNVNVFHSSNNETNPRGTDFLAIIRAALDEAEVALILCSKESITRPWINFEAGVAWYKGIPMMPVCHTDLTVSTLPQPYSRQGAVNANDARHLRDMYEVIARARGSALPNEDFDTFADDVQSFEEEYGLIARVRDDVQALIGIEPTIAPHFHPGQLPHRANLTVLDWQFNDMRPYLENLKKSGMVDYWRGMGFNMVGANYGTTTVAVVPIQFGLQTTQSYCDIAGKVMNT
ncbi:MAG: toll/interleukin-1 receptor domain-containing protein [Thermomicrobiales bacterium]